ncbi:MAG: Gldg family protein [Limisphaerales bacterium]
MADETPPPIPVRGPSRSEARFNVALSILSLLAIVLMVNYIALRHPRVISLSDEHFQELSPVTLQVLGTVTNDIDVIVFFDSESPLYTHVETMLRQYRDANRRIRLETVDYNKKPTRAEKIKEVYRLGPNVKDAVIFSNGTNHKLVPKGQLSQYNTDELVAGRTKSVKRKAFTGESFFTSALASVSHTRNPYVAYITGYGNYHSPTNVGSVVAYSAFTDLLQKQNTKVGAIELKAVAEIPREVKVVILPGLGGTLAEEDIIKLDRYLEAGGRMLVLFRIKPDTGLELLLRKWGVEVSKKMVLDRAQTTAGGTLILFPEEFGSHPILRPLRQANSAVVFSAPRPVRSTLSNQAADAPQVLELLRTSVNGVEMTDYENRVALKGDREGNIPVAAVVEKGGIQGVTEGSTRIVVLGDSLCFANNNLMQAGNYDFAWNTMSWLIDQDELIGIAPQPVTEYQFSLTKQQANNLRWIYLAGIPGGILFFGWIVWLRRQN